MIKILLKNKELESIDYVFNSLILLKRIQKIEFISEKGLRIIKNKDIKKKKAKLYNITKEIYESNKYYGILKITLIV